MAAGLTKSGLELQINHGTTAAPAHGVGGSQIAPDVAALTNGDFIVTFQSVSELGDQDIYAQQITAAGTYGDVQQDVAAFTPDQTNPSVASTANGGYVTAWEGFSHSIQLNVFNPGTRTFSTPFTIRDTSANPAAYSDPDIATFANGNYVLTYQSVLGSANKLEVAVVNPSATALVKGVEIADNKSPSPAVATAGNTALIAYLATDTGPINPGFNEIQIDEIDAAGNTLFSTLLTESPHPIGSLQVAGLADGRFAVVWADSTFASVRGAIFDPVTHSTVGIDFTISPNGNGPTLTNPHVAATADGGFVVAWDETGFARDSGTDIFAERFNGHGEPVRPDIEVNSITAGTQTLGSLAVNSNGQVLVSWTDFSASNPNSTDVNPGRIQGQLFNLTPLPPPTSDFNGDGKDDLIFQNGGTFTEWQSTGNNFTPNVYVNSVGNGWTLAGIGDFNADSKSDLIFQNGGTYTEWQSNGASFTQNVSVFTVGAGWNLAGTGDFNGDGESDLIFQNGATFTEWQSTGNSFTPNVYVNSVGAGWKLAGVSDFNGDGKSDLIWQNGGTFTEWQATTNGASNSFVQNVYVNNVGAGWTLAGVGDFNGDGESDLIWQNGGTFTEWQSNGNGFTQNVVVDTLGAGWSVAAIGDFNGDGLSDILFRNTNGTFSEWQSTATGFNTNVYVDSTVGNAWTLEYSPTGASSTPGAPAGVTAGASAAVNEASAGGISSTLTSDPTIGALNHQSSLAPNPYEPFGSHAV